MNIGLYLLMVKDSETKLSEAFVSVADHHQEEPDMEEICRHLASWSHQKASSTERFINKYAGKHDRGAEKLYSELFQGPRRGALALLRDLHDLWLLATEAQICWTLLAQAAQALRNKDSSKPVCKTSNKALARLPGSRRAPSRLPLKH
jgi:hypothetical protein